MRAGHRRMVNFADETIVNLLAAICTRRSANAAVSFARQMPQRKNVVCLKRAKGRYAIKWIWLGLVVKSPDKLLDAADIEC